MEIRSGHSEALIGILIAVDRDIIYRVGQLESASEAGGNPGPSNEDRHPMKILIIGLGNPLVTDDSVGLKVVEQLKPLLADRADVEVSEDYWGGLRLMERMIGFDRAIVVDAIQTGAPPGTIHRLTPDGIATQRSASAHDVNLSTALEFGRQAGARLPENRRIQLVGIEALDTINFGENCTPAVQAAIPQAVEAVLNVLDDEEAPV
jgi:hydrogenase maturation protease